MNPRDELPTRTEPAAGEESEWQSHPWQRSTITRENHSRAKKNHASNPGGGTGLPLPFLTDVRQEVGTSWGLFRTRFVCVRTVEADRRSADEDAWRSCARANRICQCASRCHAAIEDRRFPCCGPAPIGDSLAGKVHHSVRSVESGRP